MGRLAHGGALPSLTQTVVQIRFMVRLRQGWLQELQGPVQGIPPCLLSLWAPSHSPRRPLVMPHAKHGMEIVGGDVMSLPTASIFEGRGKLESPR